MYDNLISLINLKAKINADVIDGETGEILNVISMEMYLRDLSVNAESVKGFKLLNYYIENDTLVAHCIKYI